MLGRIVEDFFFYILGGNNWNHNHDDGDCEPDEDGNQWKEGRD